MTREVTEADFRMPEYRDAKVKDYEFRADGKLVRKDRWECGMFTIAELLGFPLHGPEGFEIPDVVERVRALAERDDAPKLPPIQNDTEDETDE